MYTCLYALARRMLSDKPEEYETIESFIIPVLKELDWPIRYCGNGVCLRRKTSSGFDLMFTYKNMPLLVIECKRFSTDILATSANKDESPSNHRLSEQVILYFKKIIAPSVQGNYRPHIIWTNGAYWIVFKDAALNDRISERLSEEELYEKFKELKSKDENDWFKRFSLIADNLETFAAALQKLSAEISFEKVFGDYTLKSVTNNASRKTINGGNNT